MNDSELLQYLIHEGHIWIINQRSQHFPVAQGLSEPDRKSLALYFEPDVLNSARIKLVDFIENPQFYAEIMKFGIPNLIDFREMAGITFIDCILISNKFKHDRQSWVSLLKAKGQVFNIAILRIHLPLLVEFGGKGER